MAKTKKITKKKECCGIYAGQDCEPLTSNNNGCMYHPDNKKPKKEKPLKTYVITMMVKFPTQAPYAAKTTGFKKKILSGEKKHTIRQNYEFWKKRIDEVNAGKAILSVRQWSGKPYNSKQTEIKQFKQGEVSYQRITATGGASDIGINTGDGFYMLSNKRILTVAKNDGVPIDLFRKFFAGGVLDGIIIHFTNLVYK